MDQAGEVVAGCQHGHGDTVFLGAHLHYRGQQVDGAVDFGRAAGALGQAGVVLGVLLAAPLDGLEHLAGGLGGELGVQAAHLHEAVDALGALAGNLDESLVWDDPLARDVALHGLALAPGGELLSHRHLAVAERCHALDLAPHVHRVVVVLCRVCQASEVSVEPAAPALLGQGALHVAIHLGEVDNVVKSVLELVGGERAARPVRVAVCLGQAHIAERLHQGAVAHLQRKSHQRRGHLGVEQRRGHDAQLVIEDVDVLRAGVEDLDAGRVGHDGGQRLQAAHCQRVDDGLDLLVVELDEAELGIVGLLAEELGVYSEDRRALEVCRQLLEPRLGVDVPAIHLPCYQLSHTGGWRCGPPPDIQKESLEGLSENSMVGDTGIEPVTPTVSR